MSLKQSIIDISLENPELSPTAIAKMFGAHRSYVGQVRADCGIRFDARGAMKRKVIEASAANPTFGCHRIARLTGISETYVRQVRSRFGFKANHVVSKAVGAANESGLQSLR